MYHSPTVPVCLGEACPRPPAVLLVQAQRGSAIHGQWDHAMARILCSAAGGMHRVSIQGSFSFRDLRQLERECGQALEQAHLALEIDLDGVTEIDEPARVYLDRLVKRGALITGQKCT